MELQLQRSAFTLLFPPFSLHTSPVGLPCSVFICFIQLLGFCCCCWCWGECAYSAIGTLLCVCVCVPVALWPLCFIFQSRHIALCNTTSRTEHNTQRPKAFYLIIFHENEMLLLCIGFGMCGWRIFLLCTRAREFMPLPVSKIVMFILCCRRNESTEWNPIMGAMSRGCTALHWDALRVYAHCTHNRQTGLWATPSAMHLLLLLLCVCVLYCQQHTTGCVCRAAAAELVTAS